MPPIPELSPPRVEEGNGTVQGHSGDAYHRAELKKWLFKIDLGSLD